MIAMISMHPSIMYGDFRENKLNSLKWLLKMIKLTLTNFNSVLYCTNWLIRAALRPLDDMLLLRTRTSAWPAREVALVLVFYSNF